MKIKKLSIAALSAAIVGLAGCGGGSDPVAETVVPSQIGVLTDSAVGGVSYLTSSGYSGTTDANGQFRYNSGEKVTFSVGALTLGTVDAATTITPIQLAGDGPNAANVVTNLLILLQSLDADGNPENGITINEETVAAASKAPALDLTVEPEIFASNAAFTNLRADAGLTTEVVKPEDALAHFRSQFFKQLEGTWYWYEEGGKWIRFTFGADGSYTHEEQGPSEGDGFPGIEKGTMDWDPVTGQIKQLTQTSDSNGTWGLTTVNEPGDEAYFRIVGDKLVISDRNNEGNVFERQTKADFFKQLAGTWMWDEGEGVITFTFEEDGNYVHEEDSAPEVGDDGWPGTERGRMDWDVETGRVTLVETYEDNNGSWGLSDVNDEDDAVFFRVFGGKLIVSDRENPTLVFERVK